MDNITSSNTKLEKLLQGGQKMAYFFVRLNFIIWTDFQIDFTVRIMRKIFDNTIAKDSTTPQVCQYFTTL